MSATLTDLITTRTRTDYLGFLLAQLQGVGRTIHNPGTAQGAVTMTGTTSGTYSVVVSITGSGQLGAAAMKYSLDGGSTYSAPATIPLSGLVTAVGTGSPGLTFVFTNGPSTVTSTSFVSGDVYSISIKPAQLPVTAWQPGGTALTLLEALADALADLALLDGQIAAGGLVDTSTGSWLDLLAGDVYALTRGLGVQTIGQVVLTDGGAGPFTINIGDLLFSTATGLQYRNTSAGTLNQNGTLTLTVQAVAVGSVYNCGNGAITILVTPKPGVTCNNPAIGGSGTWVTTSGADTETDSQLQTRCKNRWPAISGLTAGAYDTFCKAADAAVTRTFITPDLTTPGQVDVYLAGSTGGVVGSVVTNVQNYLATRIAISTTVSVASSTPVTITVTGNVYCYSAQYATASAQATVNLSAYVAAAPLGGTIYVSEVVAALGSPTGVRNVSILVNGASADIVLAANQVAVVDYSGVTFNAV